MYMFSYGLSMFEWEICRNRVTVLFEKYISSHDSKAGDIGKVQLKVILYSIKMRSFAIAQDDRNRLFR